VEKSSTSRCLAQSLLLDSFSAEQSASTTRKSRKVSRYYALHHSKSINLPLNQNYMMLISMRIRMQGFVVFDFEDKYPQARKELAQWLSEGKLKRKETIVKGGISKAEEALVGLFAGKNIGTSSALP
jgi:NADPH-dependent curcumin reductase CurA